MKVEELIGIVKVYGLSGILFAALLFLLTNPEKIDALRALLLKPFFNFFNWFGKSYIASDVASQVSSFLREHVTAHIPYASRYKLRIKWVSSPSDPILNEDGTLLIRLKATDDRSHNILSATKVALPRIVCPALRSTLEPAFQEAIDLTLLRRLSLKIGKHSVPIFNKHFLTPGIAENPRVKELFENLVELDNRGVFVSIFLSELHFLEERLLHSGESLTEETEESVAELLGFLLPVARRKIHEEIELQHASEEFKVGIVLLARAQIAEQKGIAPYVDRVDKYLTQGFESIYMVVFPPAFEFFTRVEEALYADNRTELVNLGKIRVHGTPEQGGDSNIKIILLRRLSLLGDVDFSDTCAANGIQIGSPLEGRVLDVSQQCAIIDVRGVIGMLPKEYCAWTTVTSCENHLAVNDVNTFFVHAIESSHHRVILSLRNPQNNPWKGDQIPEVGEKISVLFSRADNTGAHGEFNGAPVLMPLEEISWLKRTEPDECAFIGAEITVLVTTVMENKRIAVSLRALDPDPWPKIQERLTQGTRVRGVVTKVQREFVTVALAGEGIEGRIPREEMLLAGHEYADFENTVVRGQGLNVVVKKVFAGKRKISLELERNK